MSAVRACHWPLLRCRLFEPVSLADAVDNAKNVMQAFAASTSRFSDPTLVHNLSHVARMLHDSIDFNTFDDERRQIAVLINAFVRKVMAH